MSSDDPTIVEISGDRAVVTETHGRGTHTFFDDEDYISGSGSGDDADEETFPNVETEIKVTVKNPDKGLCS